MHGIDNWDKSTMQRNMMLNPNFSPQAALNFDGEQDEAAQERRRQERLKRKKEKYRQNGTQTQDEGDPDVLLEEAKRAKRRKQKKQRPDLWSDDSLDLSEEELEDEFDTRRRKGRRKREDWYDVWDE